MRYFMTNAGMGHQQYAILLLIDFEQSKYLIVDVKDFGNDSSYIVGETCNMNSYEVEVTHYCIKDSPLYSPLFEFFVQSLKDHVTEMKNNYSKPGTYQEPSYYTKCDAKVDVLDDVLSIIDFHGR